MVALKSHVSDRIEVDLDKEADVLYVTFGPPRSGYGDHGESDVILRFSEDDDSPIGATVVGYAATGWPSRKDGLARIIARHLKLPANAIREALSSV